MEPRIQYAKTSDGVNIAYDVIGSGPPIVWVSAIWSSHLSMTWRDPGMRSVIEDLATDFTLVRYDGRGSGLSQREPLDFSLEARLRDLEAVIDSTQPGSFALMGALGAGAAAIAYAARHPDRVSGLILNHCYASGRSFLQTPAGRFIVALEEVTHDQWDSVTSAISHISSRGDRETTERLAEVLRASMTPDALLSLREALRGIDVSSLLREVSVPTLVIHTENPLSRLALSQELASGINNARFVVISDAPGLLFGDSVRAAIREFLGAAPRAAPLENHASQASGSPPRTAIIMFTDIADSTALTERLGDRAFRDKARELDGALRTIIREHAGTPIEGKLLGDGVLAVFTSARHAIEAALACGKTGDDVTLPLHLGLHAGDVIREDNNIYGGAVNIASRIAGLSAAGEVLVSETVRSLARTSAGVRFDDRGEQALKGVGEAVRVWAAVEGE